MKSKGLSLEGIGARQQLLQILVGEDRSAVTCALLWGAEDTIQ